MTAAARDLLPYSDAVQEAGCLLPGQVSPCPIDDRDVGRVLRSGRCVHGKAYIAGPDSSGSRVHGSDSASRA
jgi:hypothetical protein